MKFKIIDFQRRIISERAHFAVAPEDDDSADPVWMERMYDETGHWNPRLGEWANPDSALEQKQFLEVFERCMDKLPKAASRMRRCRRSNRKASRIICTCASVAADLTINWVFCAAWRGATVKRARRPRMIRLESEYRR